MTAPRYTPAPEQPRWQHPSELRIPTQRQASPAPPAQFSPATPPRPAPWRTPRGTLQIGLGVVVGLLAGLLIGSAGAGGSSTQPSTASTASAVSGVPAGGGRFRVGPDLVPGTYQTAGPDGSSSTGCYYARLKTGDGSLGDIVDNYVSQGPMTVTVARSDGFFATSGCSAWTKVG